jgi:hypothetical protein
MAHEMDFLQPQAVKDLAQGQGVVIDRDRQAGQYALARVSWCVQGIDMEMLA